MAFTLGLGQKAPDFDLPATDGKRYSLASFKNAKVLVVVFWCNHCPYVVGTEERINRFFADYSGKGVALIAINANETDNHPGDSFDNMMQRVKEKGFRFPYLRDDTQEVALAYRHLRTPHFYVFDAGADPATPAAWTTTRVIPARRQPTSCAMRSLRSWPARSRRWS